MLNDLGKRMRALLENYDRERGYSLILDAGNEQSNKTEEGRPQTTMACPTKNRVVLTLNGIASEIVNPEL
jgi:hypothetical protein